ncbi:hypothetical protein X802_00620 [Thermococcus guaymasensis DSM 11113]|uniref:MOFRL-associated domain-containing protein n=1 Tax=Thermococcus guaymasensis DSM 11113 TaxID=1432656 RepID=A0A0X1KMW6_9EURY|nr:DUF4147 domain-containing protein [Thermococcus guaymasensis]AJC72614.1 hypothetical protein X802_00620 [Thermococcus guaymasensis DSM 11113]
MVVSGERFYVLAFGKAACSMARAVVDIIGKQIEEGVIITKYGYAEDCLRTERLKVIEAGHPVPDENSLRGGKLGLELTGKVGENNVLLVLISGGGSALLQRAEEWVGEEGGRSHSALSSTIRHSNGTGGEATAKGPSSSKRSSNFLFSTSRSKKAFKLSFFTISDARQGKSGGKGRDCPF